MEIIVHSQEGKELKKLPLDKKMWSKPYNNHAVYLTITSYNAAQRQGTHKVKTRAEVSGGGAKPWRQKGTGRARHGSIRSPQWIKGGIVFGPDNKNNYTKKVNKKVKTIAIQSALADKQANNNIIVLEKFEFDKPSTKAMVNIVETLKCANKKILLLLTEKNENLLKSCRNIPKFSFKNVKQVTTYDLLNNDIVMTNLDGFKTLEGIMA